MVRIRVTVTAKIEAQETWQWSQLRGLLYLFLRCMPQGLLDWNAFEEALMQVTQSFLLPGVGIWFRIRV